MIFTDITNTAKGLAMSADKAEDPVPDAVPNDGNGHTTRADKAEDRVPNPSPNSRAGLVMLADKAENRVPVSATLDYLAELQVRRKFYIKLVNKQTNAAGALARRALGWRYDMDEGEREKMNARAARVVAAAFGGKEQRADDVHVFASLVDDLRVVRAAIEPCAVERHRVELEMKRAVRKLPVYGWAKSVHGLGELGLAVILAESGDLSKYPKKGHLWKRLGLAPYEGHAYSTWRLRSKEVGGLSADEWKEAGYSPSRRAEIFAVVSEPLFRAQTVVQGPYRTVYDRRRELTATTHDDWTKGHSHMDALRTMTKHLLKHLWQAWGD